DGAGAFSVVVECVPASLAARVTEALTILTVGIGADLSPRTANIVARVWASVGMSRMRFLAWIWAGDLPEFLCVVGVFLCYGGLRRLWPHCWWGFVDRLLGRLEDRRRALDCGDCWVCASALGGWVARPCAFFWSG